MCTTMMVLTSIAVILRQMFSNKIKPQKEAKREMQQMNNGAADTKK